MQPKLLLVCLAWSLLKCTLAYEDLTAVAAPIPIEALYAAPPLPSPPPLPLSLPYHYDFNAFNAHTGYAAATPFNNYWDAAYAAHAYAATAPASYAAPYALPPAHTAYAYAGAPVAPVAAAPPPTHYAHAHGRARVRAHAVGPPITKHYVRIGYAYAGGAAPLAAPVAAAAAPVAYAAPAPLPAPAFRAPADTLPFGIIG